MRPTAVKWPAARPHLPLLLLLAAVTVLSWEYLAREAFQMLDTGVCQCLGMPMSGPDLNQWPVSLLLPLFGMWTIMMVAMMLPSAVPMILLFGNYARRQAGSPALRHASFVGGYLIVWTLFSAVAAVLQWLLHSWAVLSPGMELRNQFIAGALLIAGGIFQWSPLKNRCLVQCRSPLTFVMAHWRTGRLGSLRMGLEHGIYCAGCCALLMSLLFVAGVMNLWWIAFLTLLVIIEKTAPHGAAIGRVAGVAFIGWGATLLSTAL